MLKIDLLIHEIIEAVARVEPIPGLPGVVEYTTKPDAGITIDIVSHERPTSGYAVSLAGYEVKVSANTLPLAARQFIRYYEPLLAKNYLGAWTENNKVCLDVTTVLDSFGEALEAARINQQRAFYNLSTGKTYFTADYSA